VITAKEIIYYVGGVFFGVGSFLITEEEPTWGKLFFMVVLTAFVGWFLYLWDRRNDPN